MEIHKLCKDSHTHAVEKGFWEKKREIGTLLMLVVSELGKALEADRKDNIANLDAFYKRVKYEKKRKVTDPKTDAIIFFETYIKDSFEDEIADTFIRLADLCEGMEIDIERFIKLKMEYNKTRPHKHGKSY